MLPHRLLALFAAMALVLAACTSESEPVPTTGAVATTAPVVTTTSLAAVTTSTSVPPETPTTTSTITSTSTTMTMPIEDVRVTLVEVDDGFDNPVLFVAAPDGGADLVVEQPGRIVRADGGAHEVILDITEDVGFGGERGLLGFAIHPDFESNRLVYVNYTDPRRGTVVEQFEMRQGAVDVATRTEIIRILQPAGNHNGGMIAFGPRGNLWIGMGDGGGSNDQYGTAQRTDSLLGSMLRIVVGGQGDDPYLIPADNPYATGEDGRQEVWAIGLRNPWRFTFDGDWLWIGDVGQNRVEEIDLADANVPNLNYGWSTMEGSQCFRSNDCDSEGLVLPIAEYGRDEGCSVIGGVVYRGSELPSLAGQYFYSDLCSGFLRSLSVLGDEHDWTDQIEPISRPTGFGTGSDGEMYIVTQSGSLLRLEEAE